MDLQSFCVRNRKKVHSFQYLESSMHPQKMPEKFSFGVPVKAGALGDHCFNDYHNMSCKPELNFQDVTKNSDCLNKKTCFEPFTKFSSFSFSKVVGGFVGSKSQGGSASREPHQVWDIILRQLVDTTCQARLNNNLHQYFNIEDSLSHTIFQQFTSVANSHLDFSSYIISRPSDFFASKKMTVDHHPRSDNLCQNKDIQIPENISLHLSQITTETPISMKGVDNSDQYISPKQSYADVAKSHVPSRLESSNFSDMPPRIPNSCAVKRKVQNPKSLVRGHEKERRRRDERSSHQHSLSISSQSLRKSPPSLHSCDEHVALPKFVQDNFQQTGLSRPTNSRSNKYRASDTSYLTQQSASQQSHAKDFKVCADRRNRSSKFRNYNMKEKERKNINLQVSEDIAYLCNMTKSECQNWRCEHNRTPNVLRNRTQFLSRQERNFSRMNGKSVRLRSPPPRTFIVSQDCNKGAQATDTTPPKICEVNNTFSGQIPNERHDTGEVGNMTNSEDIIESLVTSPTTVCSDRPHLVSDCSVESEDSCVVFLKDDVESLALTDDESECGFDSGSECDSDVDSSIEGDDDEVDFKYFSPLNITIGTSSTDTHKESFSPAPDRLKDINKRWHDENSDLSDGDKTPKKVHFANPGHLIRVHLMVHWGFAHREARRGPWEEIGRDRCRFQMRIATAERELASILDPEHRRKVLENRMCLASV